MRKFLGALLTAAALVGIGNAPVTTQAAPTPRTLAATDSLPTPSAIDKVLTKHLELQVRQVQVKTDSVKPQRHTGPKRRYHRQHWRRVYKGW